MGSPSASNGSNDTQVSGYEAVKTKQSKGTAKELNKNFNVSTYGDTKTGRTFGGEYSKENQNPNDNIQTKKTTTTYNGDSGSDNNNTITKVTKTAPTEAEVSQATTTEADADTEANRLLKVKKKGRSMTMMSGAKGVTKTSADYSLGKTSLLGRV